jgi:hypothetical protein
MPEFMEKYLPFTAGYKTAITISEEAKARVFIGRRVFHNVTKIERYLEKISM